MPKSIRHLQCIIAGTLQSYIYLGLLVVMAPSILSAQKPDLVPSSVVDMDSTAMQLAAEKADTGRWISGYKDLSRYDTPGYCMALILNITKTTLRRGEMDTIEVGSATHGNIPWAREMGRKCASALSIETVSPQEYYNFMYLLIAIDDSVRFDSLLKRQFELATNDEERAWILSDAANLTVNVRPISRDILSLVFAQLDSFGPSMPDQWAHALAARRRLIWEEYDTVAMWENNPVVQRWSSFPKNKQFSPAYLLVVDSLENAYYQRDTLLPQVSRKSFEQLFRDYRSGVEPQLIAAVINDAEHHATFSRKEVFPFQKGTWFPEAAGTMFLNSGKVTLVYKISRTYSLSIKEGRLNATLAQLRRLKEMYGDKVDVVLHVPTEGYLWSSPPLSVANEAKALRWLFFEHLKLPFILFVDETPIAKRSDGRLLRGESPNNVVADANYLARSNGLTVIDKNNRIIHFYDTPSEARLRTYIARALKEESETASSSQSSTE